MLMGNGSLRLRSTTENLVDANCVGLWQLGSLEFSLTLHPVATLWILSPAVISTDNLPRLMRVVLTGLGVTGSGHRVVFTPLNYSFSKPMSHELV